MLLTSSSAQGLSLQILNIYAPTSTKFSTRHSLDRAAADPCLSATVPPVIRTGCISRRRHSSVVETTAPPGHSSEAQLQQHFCNRIVRDSGCRMHDRCADTGDIQVPRSLFPTAVGPVRGTKDLRGGESTTHQFTEQYARLKTCAVTGC